MNMRHRMDEQDFPTGHPCLQRERWPHHRGFVTNTNMMMDFLREDGKQVHNGGFKPLPFQLLHMPNRS